MCKEILHDTSRYPVPNHGAGEYGKAYEQKMVLYSLNSKPANVVVGWMEKVGKTQLTTVMINAVGKGEKD